MSNKDIGSMHTVDEEKPLKRGAPVVTESPKDPSPKKRRQGSSEGNLGGEESKGEQENKDETELNGKLAAEVNEEENKEESESRDSNPTQLEEKESLNDQKEPETGKSEHKESESITKEESKPSEEKKEEKSSIGSKKYVFGSSSAFGKAAPFSVEKPKSGSGSIFGSGSKFGDAFKKAVSRKSIFDQEAPSETSESKPETDTEKESSSLYQAVDVERQELTTGEEEEQFLFSTRAKLYCLDATLVSQGWKERGVGVLRVNKLGSEDSKGKSYTARLVMRQDTTFKVILNIPIIPDFKPVKGLESSMAPEKFIRFKYFEDGKPVQFAIKTANKEVASELYTAITDCMG